MDADLPEANHSVPKVILWISPIDDRNAPVDPVFLDAAQRIGSGFFRYRAGELDDNSRLLELIEKAVHRSSRARSSRPVDNPVAYLFRTFTRLMDHELEHSRRFVSLSGEMFDRVGRPAAGEPSRELDREILWREVLDSVDDTTRSVLNWLRWGRSVEEIARELGITPNTLSKRLSRLRRQLKRRLDLKPRAGGT